MTCPFVSVFPGLRGSGVVDFGFAAVLRALSPKGLRVMWFQSKFAHKVGVDDIVVGVSALGVAIWWCVAHYSDFFKGSFVGGRDVFDA